ncbi:zona pellucida sperm-binding protein 3-like [Scophthalmus maximus]|uniref:Zona pellucida sperm-binding protein 3-like n=1 Tax=Scophthalmus maximus TaxID=52904 RepID=A0A2U9BKH4_SCOMX|nr:zona pellucida sperm-binding protein 3-like [Scophthalmus maximus]AWP04574.1 zona pellucida sperm-binding protein 3-like [Scophthalmus maximus]
MMAFFRQRVLLLAILVAAVWVDADMKLDCRPDHMTLVWTESRTQVDPSLFRLGNCFPTSVAAREAAFSVALNDCNFKRMVTGDHLLYTNDLTFISSPDSHLLPFSHPVVCAYERPKDWYPLVYDPVFNTYGQGDLVFHIGLMNVDFSGPAASTTFPLGSFIPIMASVEQNRHQPLLLLLEECVAAPTPEMQPGSPFYPIITNKGCLMDSKISGSKFEPRQKSSEIRLSLQTFKFSVDVEVYIHCELVAWDPFGLDNTKKACHYIKDHGWELLDDPEYSNLCDCCDSSCKSRRMRSIASGKHGVVQKAVLGPLTITET